MFKKPVAELTDDEREQVDEIDLKCLTLLQCVLERVEEVRQAAIWTSRRLRSDIFGSR